MNKTKIVCTIGPASADDATLGQLLEAGMAVARLNFSHGETEWHRNVARRLRQSAAAAGVPLAILQDLSGPKVRIGNFAAGRVFLTPGQPFTLTATDVEGDVAQVHVPIPGFVELARGLPRLLLADGMIELRVERETDAGVATTVQVGGWLASHQGLSFPGRALPLPPLTAKDRQDLLLGVELEADFVALSFVRSHADVTELKQLLHQAGSRAQVIAKLERPEALSDLDAILDAADGVMVARGDLGIELPPERVPVAQKQIIRAAQRHGKYVITATQMLESMVHSPWPTRAEASDVANAVLDGSDAVMLSGETASGEYPVRTVQMMRRIIVETEQAGLGTPRAEPKQAGGLDPTTAIGCAAVQLAETTGAKGIAAFTNSGKTARVIAKQYPAVPVYGITPQAHVQRQVMLGRGVVPLLCPPVATYDEMLAATEQSLLAVGLAAGDLVVVTAGYPFRAPWQTNLVQALRLGAGTAGSPAGLETAG